METVRTLRENVRCFGQRILKAEQGALTHVSAHPRGLPHVTVETVAGGGHLFPMTHADVARDALFEAAV